MNLKPKVTWLDLIAAAAILVVMGLFFFVPNQKFCNEPDQQGHCSCSAEVCGMPCVDCCPEVPCPVEGVECGNK